MFTRYFIQDGLIVKKSSKAPADNKDAAGLFSLDKLFKKLLARYHVAFEDDCCTGLASPNGTDVTDLPIRYNKTAAKLQYYEPTTKTWTNLTTF